MSNISLLYYTLTICIYFGICIPSLAVSNSCTDYYSLTANIREPSLQDMHKHLMGVHVTDMIPEGGVLKAAYNRGMSMRPTVHFALGEMVISHDYGNWESKNYAVLAPFDQLEPQLLNIFHQDTFVIGDLKLKKGSILIVPEGESINPIENIEIIRYTKGKQTLRGKIEDVLRERNQWVFKGSGGQTTDPVRLFGMEIDQKRFFKSIFVKYPHVTFGLHATHPLGKIDHLISDNLSVFRDPKNATSRNYFEWIMLYERLKIYLRESNRFADLFKNSPEIMSAYKFAKKIFKCRMNVILAEIEIQQRFGKTLLGANGLSKEFSNQIKAIAENYPKLIRALEANADKLPSLEVNTEEALLEVQYSYLFHDIRNTLTVNEFSKFLNEHPEIRDGVGGTDYQLGLRFLDSTKSLPQKKKMFTQMLSTCSLINCSRVLFRLLKKDVGFDKDAILTTDSVAKNLGQFYDLRAFTHLNQTENDINSWIWFARELRHSINKETWWQDGLRIYDFIEVQPLIGKSTSGT